MEGQFMTTTNTATTNTRLLANLSQAQAIEFYATKIAAIKNNLDVLKASYKPCLNSQKVEDQNGNMIPHFCRHLDQDWCSNCDTNLVIKREIDKQRNLYNKARSALTKKAINHTTEYTYNLEHDQKLVDFVQNTFEEHYKNLKYTNVEIELVQYNAYFMIFDAFVDGEEKQCKFDVLQDEYLEYSPMEVDGFDFGSYLELSY